MDWLFQGGEQEHLLLPRIGSASLTKERREALRQLVDQHKLARKNLDKDAVAWANKQVPLSSPVPTDEEAAQWDRAYLAARSEQLSGQCYEDDKQPGAIATCSPHHRVKDLTKTLSEPALPCNADYWKALISGLSAGTVSVGKSSDRFQFFYIRHGMEGLATKTPFEASKLASSSQNAENLSWDEAGQQLHSDISDAVVVFNSAGDLVQVFRLSTPIIVDINKRLRVDGKYIDADDVTGYRYVGQAPTRYVVDSWDGQAVIIYRNRAFGYYGLAVEDKYRRSGRVFVDIHGPGYTYGCSEAVEALKFDSANKCMGLQETVTAHQEDLPGYESFLDVDSSMNPVALPKGHSRPLGHMHVIKSN